jgi:hypothetical protein
MCNLFDSSDSRPALTILLKGVCMIPTQSTDISAEWLGQKLGRRVQAVRAENLGAGIGILGEVARLHVTYAPGETGPATLVSKCQSLAPENIGIATAMGFYDREVNFYRHAAATMPVRLPRCYAAEMVEGSVPFVLVLEDIVGARCPNQIAGIAVADAERILDTVAAVHAHYWETDELESFTWLPPMNNPMYKGAQALADMRLAGYLERFGDRLNPAALDTITTVIRRYPEYLDWIAGEGNATLTHTDCRAENYLFGGPDGDDAITMLDFQLSTKFSGMYDVANLISGSLLPDVRRANEAQLVERYHQAVIGRGVRNFSLDRCWRDYRACLVLQAFGTVVVSNLEGGNDRGAELMNELLLRPALTLNDHDVSDVLASF